MLVTLPTFCTQMKSESETKQHFICTLEGVNLSVLCMYPEGLKQNITVLCMYPECLKQNVTRIMHVLRAKV